MVSFYRLLFSIYQEKKEILSDTIVNELTSTGPKPKAQPQNRRRPRKVIWSQNKAQKRLKVERAFRREQARRQSSVTGEGEQKNI